ncbi:TonB-dependent receptor [Colwellia sp. 1_MG-2023]|uniref:TonB-dependent receptor n=1 Tax=unclassified Colwellia TaxID=196834 RepID=UPI001C0A3A99|nr:MULTISPECIES: TonB-dependent receptor [unclassified Colwellia]MBU2925563.1 TonB-dependent receptor [Colwellia sp. C2M11]MDO6651468.1 TonB-dependent receptor [Colwellia sp. 3_MG-2023]MDO6666823.1 TonB-dependent receptor [Colwellia sp. 2_MG-2023]MDO6690957.1 TonB-dependent receptor [Colwellia sp. 1_MG-2023]
MKKSLLFTAMLVAFNCNQSYAEVQNDGIEKMTVTGSHIKRADLETASPLSVITAEQIALSGIVNVEDLLQRMSFSAGVAGNATNAYWTSGGYGTAQVNLRGMGIKRTLVLLNGRRMVNGGTGANSSADLNTIPTGIIKRIEILKDGASAIYGADAVAGVVNIITKDDIDGVTFMAKAGASDEGDGEHQEFNLNIGSTFDRGNFILSANYVNTEAVRQSDRIDCAKEEIVHDDGTSELSCFGSSTTEGGRALLADGQSVQFNQDTQGDGNAYEAYDSQKHAFTWIPYLNAVSPSQRLNLAATVNYQLTEQVNLFTEAMYSNRQSEQIVTPRSLSSIYVSKDFDYNPTGQDLELTNRRNTEFGAPFFFQETNTIRLVLGLNGEFSNNWHWDTAYNYSRNTGNDGWTFDLDSAKAADTLNEDVCSYEEGASIPCGDWFGVDELSQEVIDYVKYRREGNGGNEMRSFTFNLGGDLTELPAGTLAFATGIEHRYESGWRNPDSTVLSNGGEDTIDGDFNVTEAFVEFSIPLLSDLPLMKSLHAEVASRYADYSTFGDKTTYKLGLTWQIFDNLMVRGVKSTAFRIPMLTEQFGGTNSENLRTIDPCEGATGAIATNCLAAGVPANFEQDGTTVLTAVGGNPDVNPESADTLTLGIVWQASFLEGLSATVDYFNIEIDDAITAVNGSDVLKLCYTDPNAYSEYCDSFSRHSVTNQVISLNQRPVNAAQEKVSGVDFNVQHNGEINGFNTKIELEATRLLAHENTPLPGQAINDLLGKITEDQGSYTKWRGNLGFTLEAQSWATHYAIRYIGGADDVNGGGPIGSSVPSITYHDVQASYQVNNNFSLSAGIDNLFDKSAPFLTSWNDANTDVMTYDLLGRRGYLKLNVNF